MTSFVQNIFFTEKNDNSQKLFYFAVLFPFFTIFALGIDSVYFTEHFFDGRVLTNFLVITYFLLFFKFSDHYLRRLLFLMLFLSYLGEFIFCTLLGFYAYRTEIIPLYVPFGHAIVYASGYVYAFREWAVKNDESLRKYFGFGFLALFLSAGFFWNDQITLIFGALFFLLLKRKKWQNLYYFIALCVVFIELTGTFFQCWKWKPEIYGFSTTNPPMGAVFIYAGGDLLLSKIAGLWNKKN